jgi:hypothetical protein
MKIKLASSHLQQDSYVTLILSPAGHCAKIVQCNNKEIITAIKLTIQPHKNNDRLKSNIQHAVPSSFKCRHQRLFQHGVGSLQIYIQAPDMGNTLCRMTSLYNLRYYFMLYCVLSPLALPHRSFCCISSADTPHVLSCPILTNAHVPYWLSILNTRTGCNVCQQARLVVVRGVLLLQR